MIEKLSNEAKTLLSDFLSQIEYEKDKEIEKYKFRPSSEINFKNLMKARSENIKLHFIIKEVREYVRSNEWAKDYEKSSCRTHILEILDKENMK